jgi:hypothetical protein
MGAEASWKQRSKLVVTLTFMQIGIRSKDILLRQWQECAGPMAVEEGLE